MNQKGILLSEGDTSMGFLMLSQTVRGPEDFWAEPAGFWLLPCVDALVQLPPDLSFEEHWAVLALDRKEMLQCKC